MLTYKIGWLKIIVTGLEEWNMEIQRAVFDPDGIRIHFHGDSPAKLRFIAARPNGKFPNILNVPSSKEFFIRTRGTATRKGAKIEVSCEPEKNKSFIRYNHQKNIVIQVSGELLPLPERSPLHKNSLNLADIETGKTVYRYNIKGQLFNNSSAVITNLYPERQMMRVVIISIHTRDFAFHTWPLADIGVFPHKKGDHEFWDPENFILATRLDD